MFGNLKGGYSDLWKAIIRPPRDEYETKDLGPSEFKLAGKRIKRTDLELQNERGLKFKCSHFEPIKRPCKELPCVVYMHGNCSSRLESLNCLEVLLPQNITLFSLDFTGCGQSEGEYISLGWYEREDISVVVEHLRKSGSTSTIGLWGRSMGAVTALMHADRDPSIAGLVLDSPFSSLRSLAEDLCKQHSKIPKFVMSTAMMFIKSTIKDKAKFDIDKLNPLENHVKQAFINALFVAAKDDNFIEPKHTEALYEAYAGDKNLIMVEGDHNSARPQFMLDSVGIFFFNTLQVQYLVPQDGQQKEKDSNSNKNSNNNNEFIANNNQRRIGNEDLVQQALDEQQFYDDEDELAKAIQESLKIQNNNDSVGQRQQDIKDKKQSGSFKPRGDYDEGDHANFHSEEQKMEDYFIDDNGVQDQQQQQQLYSYNNQSNNVNDKLQQDLIDFNNDSGNNNNQNNNSNSNGNQQQTYDDLI